MKNLIQFIKFGIVGASNTLLTLIIYSILVYFGVNYIAANIIGYALGTINSYFLNSRWVFKADGSKYLFIRFAIVNLIVLSINTLLLYLIVDEAGFNKYLAQIIVTGIGMVINYVLNKIWTFKKS